ncbi:MAG: response regulator transcription factor [Phycisphaera sp.]|nr:response regulator transcription factor [Phycisphaera sp.]
MPAGVLIVEDEPEIADLIEFHLEKEGMRCSIVHSGQDALVAIRRSNPDLLVLDRMLPDVDGMDVCRKLKADVATRNIPIIMVTAKAEDADIVSGIEIGADDYVVKPFSPKVLVARCTNILRRRSAFLAEHDDSAGDRIAVLDDRLVVDNDRHEVRIDGEEIVLTQTEFGILRYLVARPGFVRSRDQIIATVHGRATVLSTRTVDVHVTALRRKLGSFGTCIETVRGVGYRFSATMRD